MYHLQQLQAASRQLQAAAVHQQQHAQQMPLQQMPYPAAGLQQVCPGTFYLG